MTFESAKITFGVIVLNGEPFIRYNLRALYPYAHQIFIVEGATPAASSIANDSGHSSDTTIETIRDFQNNEDPENKVILITAEDEGYPNGFWQGEKDEMSQAYAKRATGNYLWQVDVDEFYKDTDISKIVRMLDRDSSVTAMSFRQITIFGSLDYWVDGYYLRKGATYYHRLFKWGQGFHYKTHRPPTVLNERGIDLRDLNWVTGKMSEQKGIYIYHYSLLFPRLVYEKSAYYGTHWASRNKSIDWYENNYKKLENPFYLHNVYQHPGWLKKYNGSHPKQIQKLWNDIQCGKISENIHNQENLENIASSLFYKVCVFILERLDTLYWLSQKIKRVFNKIIYLIETQNND